VGVSWTYRALAILLASQALQKNYFFFLALDFDFFFETTFFTFFLAMVDFPSGTVVSFPENLFSRIHCAHHRPVSRHCKQLSQRPPPNFGGRF
jgi:hypothetical protein